MTVSLSRAFAIRTIGALLVLIAATACSPSSLTTTTSSQTNACLGSLGVVPVVTGLFVEPDDGLDPVVDEFGAAACTIDVSVYILTDEFILDSLTRASDRGVRVRVMLEEHPFGGGGTQSEVKQHLEDHGVEVRWSSTDIRFSHAKYIVIDRQVALIMNQNLTTSAFMSNREFAATTTEPAVVGQAQEIFDRDWNHDPIDDPNGPLVVSPTNSRTRFLDLIDQAETGIDFYAEVIRDGEIVDALAEAESRGVQVRLILDESMDEDTQDIAVQLYDAGVEIRLAEHLYIHAKLMIIDGKSAIVGSQNFTATSLDDNRELAMIVNDPHALVRCTTTFERDWLRAIPGAPT
jgi:phosphatidylserine/phosphatidylglycerophosphate/cardiolipin synthase-like enzyme